MVLKVTVDPGHGGSDPGALGSNTKEKDVNLAIARQVAKFLTAAGAVVQLTRQDDSFVSLSDRAATANSNNSDYFISIHSNSGGGKGTEVYAFSSGSKASQLAAEVLQQIVTRLNLTKRGVKFANFAVLRLTSMPAILVEAAFLDNPQEERLLNDPEKQDIIGRAISNGLLKFLGLPESEPAPKVISSPPPASQPPNPYLTMNLKSTSGVTGQDIERFIKSINADSPLAAYGDKFVQAERDHGTNALFLMALAIHEAGWLAASEHATVDKNLFGYHLDKPDGKFTSWDEGIDKVSAAITRNYLTPGGPYFITPTLQGLAANYSTDPEWAAGIAGIMQRMRPNYSEPQPWHSPSGVDQAAEEFLQALNTLVMNFVTKLKDSMGSSQ